MGFDHSNRVAFVTGGGSGIGRAISRRLAAEGAAVAAVDINAGGAGETAELIGGAGGWALGLQADVRDRGQIRAARDAAVKEFGAIHYLASNAGVVTMSSLDELTDEEWDLVLDVNLKGMFVVAQEVTPAIAEAGGGAVVCTSTIESEVVVSSQGYAQVHYNASKGGVRMLTKALAVELSRKNIRVNAVAPGAIATAFIPGVDPRSAEAAEFMNQRLLIKRVGEPEDVAAAVSFLLSDDASYITGVQLPVDGGWLAR